MSIPILKTFVTSMLKSMGQAKLHTREVYSKWSCCSEKTTRWLLPKLCSTRRFIIQTSINWEEFVWTSSKRIGLQFCKSSELIRSVLLSIQALLCSPQEDDSLNMEVGEMWKKDPKQAKEIAKKWTKLYASAK